MSGSPRIRIVDVTDTDGFLRLPPCADARFDHRSCDYWEDGDRGSKSARPSWWRSEPTASAKPGPPRRIDNPFAPSASDADDYNPFVPASDKAMLDPLGENDPSTTTAFNPFAPRSAKSEAARPDWPRKLRLLDRGREIFGSYAKVALMGPDAVGYSQFGPLSAYPRARHIRELYPRLPQSPLPAVITCVATIPSVRGDGVGQALVRDVVGDLAKRGFSAVEAYPDLTLKADEASAAYPRFWQQCGFTLAVDDERFPVMRIELE